MEDGEEPVKLEVRGLDYGKKETVVRVGEEVVMRVRLVGGWLGRVPGVGREWVVEVAEGVDLALVSFAWIAPSTVRHGR